MQFSSQGQPQLLATFQAPSQIFLPKESDKIVLIAYHEDKIQVSSFSNTFKPLWSKSFDLKTEDLAVQSVGATRDGYFYIGGYFSRKRENADHFMMYIDENETSVLFRKRRDRPFRFEQSGSFRKGVEPVMDSV